MHIVSSILTNFYTKIYFWIPIILFIVGTISYFVFELSNTFLFAITFGFLIFYVPWFFLLKNVKIVYLGDDCFKVEEEIISFKSIESIDGLLIFTIYYRKNNQNKKFSYLPKYYFPFLTPYYIKEIREIIKKK